MQIKTIKCESKLYNVKIPSLKVFFVGGDKNKKGKYFCIHNA